MTGVLISCFKAIWNKLSVNLTHHSFQIFIETFVQKKIARTVQFPFLLVLDTLTSKMLFNKMVLKTTFAAISSVASNPH